MRRSALALVVLAVAGCGGGSSAPAVPGRTGSLPGKPSGRRNSFSANAAVSDKGRSLIATARARRVVVRAHPSSDARARTLHARVLLVKQRRGAWIQAYLPTRPNLATGWLRASAVRLTQTTYRVTVRLRSHRLTLWKGAKAVLRAPIGTGRSVSPTPTGRYFVTDLIRPPDPHGFYGPYALGLSAHSPVYTHFGGGDGQVGLHGTNQPDALGHDVSHGCIRVRNAIITRLAHTLPLGTPVEISRS